LPSLTKTVGGSRTKQGILPDKALKRGANVGPSHRREAPIDSEFDVVLFFFLDSLNWRRVLSDALFIVLADQEVPGVFGTSISW
jgi:hypothetical protein